MSSAATITQPPLPKQWRIERRFYPGVALAAGVTVFIDFAPSYYLKGLYETPPLPPLVHVHGLLFTAWIVLLIAQTSLVARRRTDLHRRLGIFDAVLAAIMTVVAFFTSLDALHRGRMTAEFLTVPLTTVVLFPALVGAALVMRRDLETHQRLMMIATTELLLAAVGRLPVVQDWGAIGSYSVTDLFVAALVVYDLGTRRRLHRATVWGGLIFIASQPLRQMKDLCQRFPQ
jgi:hypothetical protein